MTAAIITTPISMPDLLGTSPADLMPTDAERHDSTPAEARERADRLRAGIVRYAEMRQDIADAFACRDWIALGYDHWYAYVEAEFGEQLARLDRGERREAVQDLRAQGMSTRQIAKATGIDQSTVVRSLASGDANASPEKVTGSDGRQHPAARPKPKPTETPEPAAVPSTAAADSGSTSPEPESAKPEQDFADLDRQLDAEMEGTPTRFRRNFSAVLARADDIWQFEPERVAEVYAADFDQAIRPFLDEMTRWCQRVTAARGGISGLRVVPGGKR